MAELAAATLRNRLQEVQRELLKELRLVPPQVFYSSPVPGEWSLGQILAHIVEIESFWIDKIRAALKAGIEEIDRTEEEEAARLSFVQEHGHDPVNRLMEQLGEATRHLNETLSLIHQEELSRPLRRIRWGDSTAAELIERVIIRHIDGHVQQIKAACQVLTPP